MDSKSLEEPDSLTSPEWPPYRLYKWRFVGMVALMLLNIGSGLNATWFGPIANDMATDYSISLNQVNWLSNATQLIFIFMALLTPYMFKRWGLRYTCLIASVFMTVGSWIRYASVPRSLSTGGAYALLIVGQLLVGASQPMFVTLAPKYSELWFDLKGRTTATMVISICNPIGTAVAQIISPSVGSPNRSRESLLVLAIISTVLSLPAVFLKSKPPIAPTYSGALPPLGPMITLRAMLFRERPGEKTMEARDKSDFAILMWGFGVFVGLTVVFSNLSSQILVPYGYSDTVSGLMGAVLILAGLVAAIITAPLFDRVLTHHLAFTLRLVTPFLSAAWFSLIWAVRKDNAGALFALFAIIGITSVTLLPVTLELASEVTRNSETAAAALWTMGNLLPFIFILVAGALREGTSASPPLNMHRTLIFTGVMGITAAVTAQFLRGKQSRRQLDEEKRVHALTGDVPLPDQGNDHNIEARSHDDNNDPSKTLNSDSEPSSVRNK